MSGEPSHQSAYCRTQFQSVAFGGCRSHTGPNDRSHKMPSGNGQGAIFVKTNLVPSISVSDGRSPFLFVLAPDNAFELISSVPEILRVTHDAQIRTLVIQAVTVNVIDNHAGRWPHNFSVHVGRGAFDKATGVRAMGLTVNVPAPRAKQSGILVINQSAVAVAEGDDLHENDLGTNGRKVH